MAKSKKPANLEEKQLESALAKAKQVIFDDLDVDVNVEFHGMQDGYYKTCPLKDHPISISRIGMMAIIIETLFVSVNVLYEPNSRWLNVEYHMSYTHVSGGSNGNRTSKRFEIPFI